jgi:Zn-dependent peptidase ImmA (M78 family)
MIYMDGNAVSAADEVIEKYGFILPLNVFDIASSEGVGLRYFNPEGALEKYGDISSLSTQDGARRIIFLNAADSPEQQAFALAHELGHYFLKHDAQETDVFQKDSLYSSNRAHLTQEKAADDFALSLLIPEDQLKQYLKESGLSTSNVAQLARVFGVSQHVMSFRLRDR